MTCIKKALGNTVAWSSDKVIIGLLVCRTGKTPIEPNLKLQAAKDTEIKDKRKYQRLMGRLIYLSHTHLDIAFAVRMVSQFMHAPEPIHSEAVYKILRYLKEILGNGILFKKNGHLHVEIYIDVDWASSTIDRRLTSGYCSFISGNVVTW
ncbi:uncharacterized mitochondrial protein AtMg00240-like [Benincasa hispida]|uniref:uncharacterized mitochondrial protein AtMg00240-like n=1 Tax=Benincasa hispida TaxID=102211 RepID=UPI0018FF8826|nr:uncharacterized mitochondrial protein AtMg00240-like [Benincasa hispida]